jgi:hypothetical protein
VLDFARLPTKKSHFISKKKEKKKEKEKEMSRL